jgi:hypothetical protein
VSIIASRLRRPGAFIAALLAVDVLYRLVLRPPIRRAFGVRSGPRPG